MSLDRKVISAALLVCQSYYMVLQVRRREDSER